MQHASFGDDKKGRDDTIVLRRLSNPIGTVPLWADCCGDIPLKYSSLNADGWTWSRTWIKIDIWGDDFYFMSDIFSGIRFKFWCLTCRWFGHNSFGFWLVGLLFWIKQTTTTTTTILVLKMTVNVPVFTLPTIANEPLSSLRGVERLRKAEKAVELRRLRIIFRLS